MQPLPDRLPLVIGVTGHRDLREKDVPRIEAEVAGIIARLRQDFLRDDETPIIVLSALAEGADRLVARVALAHGARLIAPLPLPPDEYRRDFEPGLAAGNAAEFDALLGRAIAAPVMPFVHGNSLEAVRIDAAKRAEQYRAVGLFISRHSNVLIAIWDGDEDNPAVGGTAEVVKFTREGIPLAASRSARASLDGAEIGPVIHVEAPRQKGIPHIEQVRVARWGRAAIEHYRGGAAAHAHDRASRFFHHLFGLAHRDVRTGLSDAARRELDAWETFEALINLTRQFNSEAAQLAASEAGCKAMTQSLDYLFDEADRETAGAVEPKELALSLAPRWCRMYSMADTLASSCQVQFKRDWLALFLLTFAAFLCFATFSLAVGTLLAAYCIFYALIFVIFLRARRGRHQERFLDYRALAEALRVAVYWRLVGIGLRASDVNLDATGDGFAVDPHTVGVLANAYPLKQPSELAWVKTCLRTLELLDRAEGIAHERELDPAGHAIARGAWVKGQCAFFRRRGRHHDGLAEALQGWAGILLVITAFLLAPLLVAVTSEQESDPAVFGPIHLSLVLGLLPGLAAVLTAYSERLALKAQARQYDRMRSLFERAYELLPPRIDQRTAALVRSVYRELGTEAMRETSEWVAVYRQRPIEPM
jgi:hypothetical protein